MIKVIIESAVNGNNIPTQSPYLPITPDDIINQVVESYRDGAAIAHFHTLEPETGKPVTDVSLYREITMRVKEKCDIVLSPAIESNIEGTTEERLAFIHACQPEMASISMGPNLTSSFKLLKEYPVFKHPWEREYLERGYKICDPFSYKIMESYGRTMGKYGTVPEIEICDTWDIDGIAWMLEEGIIRPPLYLQFVLGPGLRLTADYVVHLNYIVKEKLGEFNFAVAGSGEEQMAMAGVSLALGGHARVGLGDSVRNAGGELVKNSAEQVSAARQIIEGMGYEVASPDEAREILGLKGLG